MCNLHSKRGRTYGPRLASALIRYDPRKLLVFVLLSESRADARIHDWIR